MLDTLAPSKQFELNWLYEKLTGQSLRLFLLLRRMTSLGALGNLEASKFSKYLLLLNEIAFEKDKEYRLLCRIEEFENQHRFLRRTGGLRTTLNAPSSNKICAKYGDNHTEAGPARKTLGFLRFLLLSWLVLRSK